MLHAPSTKPHSAHTEIITRHTRDMKHVEPSDHASRTPHTTLHVTHNTTHVQLGFRGDAGQEGPTRGVTAAGGSVSSAPAVFV